MRINELVLLLSVFEYVSCAVSSTPPPIVNASTSNTSVSPSVAALPFNASFSDLLKECREKAGPGRSVQSSRGELKLPVTLFVPPNNFHRLGTLVHLPFLGPGSSKCVRREVFWGEDVRGTCFPTISPHQHVLPNESLFLVNPFMNKLLNDCGVSKSTNDSRYLFSETVTALLNDTLNVTSLIMPMLTPINVTRFSSPSHSSISLNISYHNYSKPARAVLSISLSSDSLVKPPVSPVNFSVTFSKVVERKTTLFSGRPGYARNSFVRTGNLVQVGEVKAITEFNYAVTAPKLTCDVGTGSDFTNVRFLSDVTSGFSSCSFDEVLSSGNCSDVGETVVRELVGKLPTHVAIFGDSEPEHVANWVEICSDPFPEATGSLLKRNRSGSNEDLFVCVGVPTRVLVRFAVSRFGRSTNENEQWKIVGAHVSFPRSGLVTVEQGKSHPLRVDVRFVDVSRSPRDEFASTLKFPLLDVYFPHDFFYPFLVGAASKNHVTCSTLLIFESILVVMYGWKLHL